MMGDLLKFKITHHSLNLYGQCDGACPRTAGKNQEESTAEES